MPALFAGKTAGDEVRVWVAACATGEEAYSLAMMLTEHARRIDDAPSIQVFATDLDEDAIRAAREGVYPPAIAADVSEERLRRFFTREPRGYRIRAEIREAVVFANHDMLKDAPFSRLDLVSCRNLFIYLNRAGAAARARDRPFRAPSARAALPRRLGDGRRRAAPVPAGRQEAPHLRAMRGARAAPADRRAAKARSRARSGCTATRCRARRSAPARSRRSGRAPKRSASARGASCT